MNILLAFVNTHFYANGLFTFSYTQHKVNS